MQDTSYNNFQNLEISKLYEGYFIQQFQDLEISKLYAGYFIQ